MPRFVEALHGAFVIGMLRRCSVVKKVRVEMPRPRRVGRPPLRVGRVASDAKGVVVRQTCDPSCSSESRRIPSRFQIVSILLEGLPESTLQ